MDTNVKGAARQRPDAWMDTENFGECHINPPTFLVAGHKKDIILHVIHLFQKSEI